MYLLYPTCNALAYITHQTVPAVSPFAVQVGQVTVLVPPGAAVGQGAVTQRDVIIRVDSGPGSALVVGHGVTWGLSTIVLSTVKSQLDKTDFGLV